MIRTVAAIWNMNDSTRFVISAIVAIAGIGWWIGLEFLCGGPRNRRSRFWLRLASPLVAIACQLVVISLILGSERMWNRG